VQTAPLTTFKIATNDYRGGGNAELTEYHPCVAWDPLGPNLPASLALPIYPLRHLTLSPVYREAYNGEQRR
jgi:hypothetical protein